MAKTFSSLGMETSLNVSLIPPNGTQHFFLSVTSAYFYSNELLQLIQADDQHLINFEDVVSGFLDDKMTTPEDRLAFADYLAGMSSALREQS